VQLFCRLLQSAELNYCVLVLVFLILLLLTCSCEVAVISPPRSDSLRERTYVLLQMLLFILLSTQNLRDASADRREILQKSSCEYLRNGRRYSKSDKYLIYHDSSRVRRNKSCKVWYSSLKDLDVKLYLPKSTFSKNHISAPMGCRAPKFLHSRENDQVLLVHPPPWTGVPLAFFFKGQSKLA